MIETLFNEDDFGEGNQQIDETQITTTLLYFSDEELTEFKKLCKIGIKKMFGEQYQKKGNLSDFLLTLLKQNYGSENNS